MKEKQFIDPVDLYAGQMLKLLRRKNGLSQQQLGKSIDVTFQQIQKYERGQNRIAVSTLARLCRVLEVEPNCFFNPDNMATSGQGSDVTELIQLLSALPTEQMQLACSVLEKMHKHASVISKLTAAELV